MSMPMCNRFHATRANRGKITTFRGWELTSLTPACAGLFERKGSGLELLKSTFNAKKIYTQAVLVYLQPFRRNSLLKCAQKAKHSPSFGC